eukprot:COSAG05_NODE_1064_length_5991_cov_12.180414_8_plen_48_part_00
MFDFCGIGMVRGSREWQQGDEVEVFSSSLGSWQPGVVRPPTPSQFLP